MKMPLHRQESIMLVNECCNPDVVCCEPETVVQEVAALMRRHHVGSVVVVDPEDRRVPIGIVTDRDIVVETIAPELDVKTITAGDIMSKPIVTVRDTEGLADSLQLMRNHKVRRIPVVTEDGALSGIVTVDDVINLLARELQTITGAIIGQPMLEAQMRR
jgi:CBS domain-containing protein